MIGEGGDQIKTVSSFAAGVTDFPLDAEGDAHERLLNFLIREDDAAYIRNGSTTYDVDTRTNPSSSFATVVAQTGSTGGIHPFTLGGVEKVFVQSKDNIFRNTTGTTWAPLELFRISTGPDVYKSLLFVNENKQRVTPDGSEVTFSEDFVNKKLIQGYSNSGFAIPTVMVEGAGGLVYYPAGLPTPNVEVDIDGLPEYVAKFNAVLDSFNKHVTNANTPAPHINASAPISISPITVSTPLEEMEKRLRGLIRAYEEHVTELNSASVAPVFQHFAGGYISFFLPKLKWGTFYDLCENLNILYTAIECHYFDFCKVFIPSVFKIRFIHNTNSSFSNFDFVSYSTKKYGTFDILVKHKSSFLLPNLDSYSILSTFFEDFFYKLSGVLKGHVANASVHTNTLIDTANDARWFDGQYFDDTSRRTFSRFLASTVLASVIWDTHTEPGTMYHPNGTEPAEFNSSFKRNNDPTNNIKELPYFYESSVTSLLLNELKAMSNATTLTRFDQHNVTPRHSSIVSISASKVANYEVFSSTYAFTLSKTINGVRYESAPYIQEHSVIFSVDDMGFGSPKITSLYLSALNGSYFPTIRTGSTPALPEVPYYFGISGYTQNTYRLFDDGVFRRVNSVEHPSAEQKIELLSRGDSLDELYTTGGLPDEGAMPPAKVMFKANNCMFVANTMEWERPLDSLTPKYVHYPRRLRQSLQNFPEAFPGTFYVDLPEDIVCGSSAMDKPVIITKRGVYRIEGIISDDGSGALTYEKIYDRVGGVSHQGAISCNNLVFFAGNDGFYMTDGYQVQPISEHLEVSYSLIDKDKIRAAYNKAENSIYWLISHGGVYDEIWVLNLGKPFGGGKACFTKLGGSLNFRPTAIAFTDEGELLRGDKDGWLFIHRSVDLADPRVNRTTGLLERNSSNELLTDYIPFDLASSFFSFGTTRLRKWVTSWDITVENINPRTDDRQSLSLQPYYNNDRGRLKEGMPGYVAMKPIAYISPPPGLITQRRKFPAGSLRCLYKQIGFKNASVMVADFSEINNPQPPFFIEAKVTLTSVSSGVWTATLNTGYNFPVTDLQGCYLYLEYDNYTTAFLITDANDGPDADSLPDTLVITHSSANPPTGGANMQKWVIRGYPKTERFAVVGYNIPFSVLSSTKDAQKEGRQ